MAQARDSNAEIMASFYRRGGSSSGEECGLRPVPEEGAGGTSSSRTGSGAGRISAPAAGGEGQGTPTNGSELGVSGDDWEGGMMGHELHAADAQGMMNGGLLVWSKCSCVEVTETMNAGLTGIRRRLGAVGPLALGYILVCYQWRLLCRNMVCMQPAHQL